MTVLLRSLVTEVGPEVAELAEGGVIILFAEGAPPELAEVSILHRIIDGPSSAAPASGSELKIGDLAVRLTSVGHLAWNKVREIGHVVINFNGNASAERPGELNAEAVDSERLVTAFAKGAEIVISA